MRITILTTSTNNVPPVIDPLETRLGHEVTRIIYDEMTPAEHEYLPHRVDETNPDWVLYVGALAEHHGKPVPSTAVLARIGAAHLLVHLCFDGAEIYWQQRLVEYYDDGRFALQVSIDGHRTGPIGDRGLVALCPVDVTEYRDLPWYERAIWCGFSGGLHAGRPEIVYPLRDRGLLTYRPRDEAGDYRDYRCFLEMCRVGLNVSITGGVIGGDHVKFRAGGELPAAGCLVLETKGSPLRHWFSAGEDYLEYDGAEDAARQICWAKEHPEEARSMASAMRAKVIERHSPAVFWSQVTERLGLGKALRPAPEVAYRGWNPDYTPPPFGSSVTAQQPAAAVALPAPRPSPPPVAGPPTLLSTFRRVNLVGVNGHVFAVPQDLGPIDLDNLDLARYPTIRRYPDVPTAQRALLATV
jgi:hypothetical protein